jgi:hypothetical protein
VEYTIKCREIATWNVGITVFILHFVGWILRKISHTATIVCSPLNVLIVTEYKLFFINNILYRNEISERHTVLKAGR